MRRHRPADHTAAPRIDDHRQIQEARPGRDVGDVGHPELIGAVGREVTLDKVGRRTRIGAALRRLGATPSPAHAPDAFLLHQPAHALLTDTLTLVLELRVDPGAAVDPPVVAVRLPDLEHQLRVALPDSLDMRKIVGGLLVQHRDLGSLRELGELNLPAQRQPTNDEYQACDFAWKVCKHVKSNAIVFATPRQTVGIGAGQMSRVDSVKLAQMKAHLPIKGCVMASDAFFPFRDGIDAAAAAGITAVIQPGGSIRDKEIIQAVDEHQMAMILTGMRHFRH